MNRPAPKITPAYLENKLRGIQEGAKTRAIEAKASMVQIGAGIGVLVLIVTFLLGQRRGKRKTTLVEIRRF